ncbi:MAG: aminobutyraldehyde dehydrogenase [Actinobacteria bacterium]|nr:aminobutyraldehyde dehydrogenase [Actinomycetota bacterium]
MESHTTMLAGGELVAIGGENESEVFDASTGELLARVADATEADVDRAVAAARRAFPAWRDATPGVRAAAMLAFADAIDAATERLAAAESANTGKPLTAAREEVAAASDCVRFFAGAGRCLEGRSAGEYTPGFTSIIRREPIGVAGLIAAWNYPLVVAAWKFCPALAAGNTVILKPAEQTPLTALILAELSLEVLPPGVFNVVPGRGETTGQAIVTHPDIDVVSLTGSSPTGKLIAAAAAQTLKRVHLELGGKAPVLIFDDADPAQVAEAIRFGGFWNSGQDCGAASRLLVSEGAFERIAEALVPAVQSLRVGGPTEAENSEMGPLAFSAHRDRVVGFIDRAVVTGASVLAGGHELSRAGYFVAPTVLTDAAPSSEIVRDEVFGPVVLLERCADEEELLGRAADTRFGLAASIFTRDVGRAMDVSRQLDFGTVWINTHSPIAVEMPWGGFRQSGYGNEQSVYSLEEYTQIKHVMVRLPS